MGMTSIRVPDDILSRLESPAARLHRSKGWVINAALREYPERGAAARAGRRLVRAIDLLHDQPELGQAAEDLPDIRELVAAA